MNLHALTNAEKHVNRITSINTRAAFHNQSNRFWAIRSNRTGYFVNSIRNFCTDSLDQLTHINAESGKSEMVDVSDKVITKRIAIAEGKVMLGKQVFRLVRDNQMRKGDVLAVAKIAGIQAAKQTATLIPLCHTLNLDKIDVQIEMDERDHSAIVKAIAIVHHRTGVEMEALTAVSVAGLTIYDMCKAVSKEIEITQIRLLKKSGGKSDLNEIDTKKSR